jgi:hypothetical protein
LDEWRARRAYGYEAYNRAGRDYQVMMIAEMTISNALQTLTQYDSIEHKDG